MEKKHVLIVDNDQNTLRSLEFLLEVANYRVTSVTSNVEALQEISSAENGRPPVELLILTTNVPTSSLSELWLIGELNRLDIKIPTLLISSYSNEELQFELTRLGLSSLLVKPFEEQELIKRAARLLEKKEGSLTAELPFAQPKIPKT